MGTHNLCFEQKYEKKSDFLSENFHFLIVTFPVYLNRHVFVMSNLVAIHQNRHSANVGELGFCFTHLVLTLLYYSYVEHYISVKETGYTQ